MRYSIRKTSLGVGSVLLGTTLVSLTAQAEEVPVLPESEAVVAEAAAEEVEEVTPPVVEDVEEVEEVPALYTAAGIESEEDAPVVAEEALVEEEVPVITDSASDGVNESEFEITEASARIIDHMADSDRRENHDVLEYTLGLKIPKDFNPKESISISPGITTEKSGAVTARLFGGLSTTPKDIMLDGEVVGTLTEGRIQFNERIAQYADRSVNVTIRDHIRLVFTDQDPLPETVSLPLDLYLNNKFATRVMVDRKPLSSVPLSPNDGTNRLLLSALNGGTVDNKFGEPLLLSHMFNFGYHDIPDSGPFRLRLTLPEGLDFFDGGDGFKNNLISQKSSVDDPIVGYEDYVLDRKILDVFDVDVTPDGDRSMIFSVTPSKEVTGSQKPYFFEAMVGRAFAKITDYSKMRFETRSDGRQWVVLNSPVKLEILNGDVDRDGLSNPTAGLLKSEYVLPNDFSVTADGKVVTTKEVKTTETIPFKTEERKNPDLAEGERKVIQEGSEGLREITVEVTYENGVEVSRGEAVSTVVKEAVNEIVEIGTGVVTEEIPFKTEERKNPDLPEGERKVIQEGKPGLKNKTTGEIIEDPVNEIVEIGTGIITEEIPFKTEERQNPELPEGERKVIQEGKNGLKNKTTGEVIEEPVNEIVEIGTGVVTEEIPYETEERENPELPEGERKVIQEGKNGLKNKTTGEVIEEPVNEIVEIGTGVVTEEIPFETEERENSELPEGERKIIQEGKPGKKNVTTGEIIEEPVNEIVEVGTSVVTETIPFETEERENPELPEGERKVIQEGKNGLKNKTTGEIIEEPVNEIIEVGTKVVTEDIPFDTEERENPELPEGERKVVQEGKPGKKNVTTGEIIDEPVNEIVEVGTKVVTEEIPFETEERENPDLPQGERRVIQEGKPGHRNVHTQTIIDEPVREIIEIGTKVVTEEIPFDTEERENPKLPEGERKVIQEGKVGHKNVHTGEIIDEPVKEIVEVGTGKVSDLTPLEPAEEVIEAAELIPAEKAEDAAELVPAEKAQDAAELTPAEKAQDAAELVPAEEAMDAAELEPSFQEAPEVIEDAPELVESAPIKEANTLPETGEADDLALFGLASLGLLAGAGLVSRRREEN